MNDIHQVMIDALHQHGGDVNWTVLVDICHIALRQQYQQHYEKRKQYLEINN